MLCNLISPYSSCYLSNLCTDIADYTTVSAELMFSTGSCRDIPIEDDGMVDGTENLFANLTTSDPDMILDPKDGMCVVTLTSSELRNVCMVLSQVS